MNNSVIWKDDNAPAIALLGALLDKYGTEALDWEITTIRKQIQEDYSPISDFQSDKLQAAITIMVSNSFETYWHSFEVICRLLTNQSVDASVHEPLDVEVLIPGVAHAFLIKGGPLEFDDWINAYAGLVFWNAGFGKPPTLFKSAIMPAPAAEADDKEKNDGLEELAEEYTNYLLGYLEKA